MKNNKPDNTHPGYKLTSLGWIPEDWEMLEFSEIAHRESGKFDPIKTDETRKCIELEHLSQETGEVLGFVDSNDQLSLKNVFSKGDILFGKLRPYLKKYWQAEFDGVCSSEIWVLSAKQGICENAYLYNLVQTNRFIQIANVSSGSKMPRADWDYVSSFPYPIPSKIERQKIATLLSTWDKAIEKTNQLIAKKEARKKWLMQQLLTGKKRLKGFKGEWKVKRLKEILIKGRLGGNYENAESNYGIPVIKMGNIGRGYINIDKIQCLPDKIEYNKEDILQEGDLLFNTRNTLDLVGKVAIWRSELLVAVYNSNIMRMTFEKELVASNSYMNFLFNSASGLNQLRSIATGTTSVAAIYGRDLGMIKFTLPPIKEQTAIANILQTADKEIQILKTKLDKLKEQKKGLMQVLLTGKVRVKINK